MSSGSDITESAIEMSDDTLTFQPSICRHKYTTELSGTKSSIDIINSRRKLFAIKYRNCNFRIVGYKPHFLRKNIIFVIIVIRLFVILK